MTDLSLVHAHTYSFDRDEPAEIWIATSKLAVQVFRESKVLSTGEAIKCYACDSKTNKDCSDIKSSEDKFKVDCNITKNSPNNTFSKWTNTNMDYKIDFPKLDIAVNSCLTAEIVDKTDKKSYLYRACALSSNGIDACTLLKNLFSAYGDVHCSLCDSDYCNSNSSNGLSPRTFIVFISILAALYLKQYLM